MATYRIMESSHERQFGLPAEAATMASMFEPVEFILRNESAGSLDLEKLDPISGEWRRMCTIVRATEAPSFTGG